MEKPLRFEKIIESKEFLFDEFAKAHFQGNYLPLGRLIDGTFGKGSFRKIAKELGHIDEKE